MVKWSDTSENVVRQLQIVQIQHIYVISSQKIKKIKLFGLILLRNFLLKEDFLGIFKNVVTGFYCTCECYPRNLAVLNPPYEDFFQGYSLHFVFRRPS
jgi:hypothetical protein